MATRFINTARDSYSPTGTGVSGGRRTTNFAAPSGPYGQSAGARPGYAPVDRLNASSWLDEFAKGVGGGVGAAAQAPARILETPVALANTAFKRATNVDIASAVGQSPIGGVFGLLGDITDRIFNFVPALLNSHDAELLRQTQNLPDSAPLTGLGETTGNPLSALPFVGGWFGRDKTAGEFRTEMFARGFDQEAIDHLNNGGPLASYDFGDKMLNDSVAVDLLTRVVADPTNLLFIPGVGAKLAARIGLSAFPRVIGSAHFEGLVKAGARVPVSPVKAAESALRGSGPMSMAGTVKAMTRSYLNPRGWISPTGYAKRATATYAGLALLANNPVGFMDPIKGFAQETLSRQPLSTNSLFLLASAVKTPIFPIGREAVANTRAGWQRLTGTDIRSQWNRITGTNWDETIARAPWLERDLRHAADQIAIRDHISDALKSAAEMRHYPYGDASLRDVAHDWNTFVRETSDRLLNDGTITPRAIVQEVLHRYEFAESGKGHRARVEGESDLGRQPFTLEGFATRSQAYWESVDPLSNMLQQEGIYAVGLASSFTKERVSDIIDFAHALPTTDGRIPLMDAKNFIMRHQNLLQMEGRDELNRILQQTDGDVSRSDLVGALETARDSQFTPTAREYYKEENAWERYNDLTAELDPSQNKVEQLRHKIGLTMDEEGVIPGLEEFHERFSRRLESEIHAQIRRGDLVGTADLNTLEVAILRESQQLLDEAGNILPGEELRHQNAMLALEDVRRLRKGEPAVSGGVLKLSSKGPFAKDAVRVSPENAPTRDRLEGRTGKPNTFEVRTEGNPEVTWFGPDGEAHGYAAVLRRDFGSPQPKGEPMAVSVYVDEAYRRQGIATQLYDKLQEQGIDLEPVSGLSVTDAGDAFSSAYWRSRGKPTDPRAALADHLEAMDFLADEVGLELPSLLNPDSAVPMYFQQRFAEYNRMVREESGGVYELKEAPILNYQPRPGDGLPEFMMQERNLIAKVLTEKGPLSPIGNFLKSLLEPVEGSRMAADSMQAVMDELIGKGAKSKDVIRWVEEMREEAMSHAIDANRGVRFFGSVNGLLPSKINSMAIKAFGGQDSPVVQAVGANNFYRVLDRSSSRVLRNFRNRQLRGAKRGKLERLVNDRYLNYRSGTTKGLGGVLYTSRIISNTMYHMFRFLSDLRWHALNRYEDHVYALTSDGVRPHISAKELSPATRRVANRSGRPGVIQDEAGPISEKALLADPADTGWFHQNRVKAGKVSKVFDQRRLESTEEVLKELWDTDPALVKLRRDFPDASPKDLAQRLDEQWVNFDQQGVHGTIKDEYDALFTDPSRPQTAQEAWEQRTIIQRLSEVNQRLYDDLVGIYSGNPNRTQIERVMNSYWLYWPISYQIKASRWLLRTLGERAFGNTTNFLGFWKYDQVKQYHLQQMASNPMYAQQFDGQEHLWQAVSMFFPITPEDIGVNLSRPIRAIGSVTGITEPNRYLRDPFAILGYIMQVGPLYTARMLADVGKDIWPDPIPQGMIFENGIFGEQPATETARDELPGGVTLNAPITGTGIGTIQLPSTRTQPATGVDADTLTFAEGGEYLSDDDYAAVMQARSG